MRRWGLVAAAAVLAVGCMPRFRSKGGGQIASESAPRKLDVRDVAVPAEYQVEVAATGLTFPTGVTFDAAGTPHVVESGYSYGEVFTTPRLVRIGTGGAHQTVASGTSNGPWNGVTFHDGAFFVAEGGVSAGGRVLRIEPNGKIETLVSDLPSLGDHHTNGPVAREGWIYFGQGAATNSGVVGEDNAKFGWLKRRPDFHDVPCQDVVLSGENFTTKNPLTVAPDDEVTTGAYVPFGTATEKGQVVEGKVPCTGAIMRVRVTGGDVELVAWGFRNPFGLAFAPDGRLFATDNGFDERGSRPIYGAADMLWKVEPGGWHGWPDFAEGRPVTSDRYGQHQPTPKFVLASHPGTPPKPAAYLGVHSSSDGLDFSRNPSFGYVGNAFIAQFGDQAPAVGKVAVPVGFKVVRVDVSSGVIRDFAVNRGKTNGPASKLGKGGLERPVAVRFDPDGNALYVVDFGVLRMDDEGRSHPAQGTGVLWKITRKGGAR